MKHGIHFEESFAPTMRMTTLRMSISIVIQFDLILHRIDVNTVYLNSELDIFIFMKQPEGFVTDPHLYAY